MPSTAEIVARLTLNGEKFSSETARLFGSLETAAKEAGQQVEGQLGGRITKIQEIAARGVSIDIQGLKEGAVNASATAAGLKTIADAADRAAAKAGGLDNALNAQAVATRNAAAASEVRAAKLMEEARAMDLLQAELGQTVAAQGRMQASTKGAGGSLAMAGQQVQDFVIQVQNGQNPIAAFSQQMSQMGFALQGAGGWLGKVGNVLMGPWGLAIVGAGLAAATFSDHLFGTEKKAKDAEKSIAELTAELEKQAKQTWRNQEAQEAFTKSLPGAVAEMDKLSRSILDQNRTLEENIRLKRDTLLAGIASAGSQIGTTSTELGRARVDQIKASDELKQFLKSPPADFTQAVAGEAFLRKRLDDANASVRRLTDDLTSLSDQLERGGRALDSFGVSSAKELRDKAERERKERERESRPRGARPDNDATSFINPVGGGRVTGEWNEQRTGRRHAGIDLAVPVGTAVKAAAAGVVIETGNDPGGYGNFVIIDHGRGTTTRYAHLLSIGKSKGSAVDQGDVIGASGGARGAAGAGNSRGPHLHYEVRRGRRPVDPRTGSFATDSANVQDAAADRAEAALKRQQEVRERLLDQANKQLSIEVETARYFGLAVAGLDKQAETEKAVAAIRRESADWLKQSVEGMDPKKAEEFLAAESKVGDAFKEKLAAVDKQGEAYALLLSQSGDLSLLTEAQKAAILQQNEALAAQLKGAEALVKTEAERVLLRQALLRLEGRAEAGAKTGADAVDFQKKIYEANQKAADTFR